MMKNRGTAVPKTPSYFPFAAAGPARPSRLGRWGGGWTRAVFTATLRARGRRRCPRAADGENGGCYTWCRRDTPRLSLTNGLPRPGGKSLRDWHIDDLTHRFSPARSPVSMVLAARTLNWRFNDSRHRYARHRRGRSGPCGSRTNRG